VEESATILFSFDPDSDEVRRLGQLCVPAFRDRREAPYATLSLALGHDRKLYYGAAAREFDYGGSRGAAASRLITYDLRSGETADLGEMILPDGRRVLGTNAADTGPDGTVYFVGAVEVHAEAGRPVKAGGRIGGSDTYFQLALIIYHPRS
jgi:hypothetical protein